MKYQPECVLGNRFNAVPPARRNEEIIAGLEIEGFTSVECQARDSRKKDHPFGVGLVIPETLGTGFSSGGDRLESEASSLQDLLKNLPLPLG